MMMHTLKAVALVSTMITPAPTIAHHEAQIQQQHTTRSLSTDRMYRDYMESGSIYYGDHTDGPPAHIVKQVSPTIQAIEAEGRQFAFASDPHIPTP